MFRELPVGLISAYRYGDTVIAARVAYHDVAETVLTEYHPWMPDHFFGQENFAKYCDLASRNSFKVVELVSKSSGEW